MSQAHPRDALTVQSIQCPSCHGPLPVEVLDKPVRCLYCNAWVATHGGQQKSLRLTRQQAQDVQRGLVPADPVFHPGTPLDRLAGRIWRAAPVFFSVPMVWCWMMLMYVNMGWLSSRALFHDEWEADVVLGAMCILFGLFGCAPFAIVLLLSMSFWTAVRCWPVVAQTDDLYALATGASGIGAMLQIGTPVFFVAVWAMMQRAQDIQWHLARLHAARSRLGISLSIGLVLSLAFFSRPTSKQFLESKRAEFMAQAEHIVALCQRDGSEESRTGAPSSPRPHLEIYNESASNVESISCPHAVERVWSHAWEDKNGVMQTRFSRLMGELHEPDKHDERFLKAEYEARVTRVLSAPYWLLFDLECRDKSMTARLYDAKTQALLSRVVVPCVSDDSEAMRAVLEALQEDSSGVFTTRL